jgi:transposase
MNKDHRPDLKQLVFGLNVTADGAVPISHDIYSGNRTDDTIHLGNVDSLRQLLGRSDFIYVADSKLATRKNLGDVLQTGRRFFDSAASMMILRRHSWEGATECQKYRKTIGLGRNHWRSCAA